MITTFKCHLTNVIRGSDVCAVRVKVEHKRSPFCIFVFGPSPQFHSDKQAAVVVVFILLWYNVELRLLQQHL